MEDFPKQAAHAWCSKLFECCKTSGLSGTSHSEADCEQAETKEFSTGLPEVKAEIAAGRLKYDAEVAADCVSAVESHACGADVPELLDSKPPSACRSFLVGLVPTGDTCSNDVECAVTGSACARKDDAKLGTCVAPAKEGAACAGGFLCAEGLVCSGDSTRVCAKPRADGQPCQRPDECSSGRCDISTSKCAPKQKIGGSCNDPTGCAEGYCDVEHNVCAAKKAEGAPCTSSDECASGRCGEKGVCDVGLATACSGK